MEAARGQKHPSEAKNGMKEAIYWKKLLMKVAQQPQKTPDGSNQIWATTSGKKEQPPRSLYKTLLSYVATAAAAAAGSNIPDQRLLCTLI
jgi:hypothetical protein